MGHRAYTITRGARKGETAYATPPTLDVTKTADQRAMVRHHINFVSFYAGPDLYVCDGHVTGRKGPRSRFNIHIGTVFQVWPHIFDRIEIEKMKANPKGKAAKRKSGRSK